MSHEQRRSIGMGIKEDVVMRVLPGQRKRHIPVP